MASESTEITQDDPKMVKYVGDECYGLKFNQLDKCPRCWLKESCENSYKAMIKKQKSAGKKPVVREKKYKKTDKYREWY